ncbi:hypothetical protein TWF506_009697 [Arthrobotrys conoides]|uniref:Uncharacterized protein n=1 Tax=Arthrobotrys conoides TaxID=74498 RepID=A0AAN8NBZ3_9PEZI
MLLQRCGRLVALGIVLSGFGSTIPAGAVPDADGYDIILQSAINKYLDNNKNTLQTAVNQLRGLVAGYRAQYRFDWHKDEKKRVENAQQARNRWEEKTLPREEPWLDPFEVVPSYSYENLTTHLQAEMLKLSQKIPTPETVQQVDLGTSILNSNGNLPSLPISEYTAARELQLSMPLPLYTLKDVGDTITAIAGFIIFVQQFEFATADLAPKFFLFQRRSVDLERTSILRILANFMESQAGGSNSFLSLDRSDTRRFTEHMFSIPDDIIHTDRSDSEESDDEYYGYEPLLPLRHEFQPSGLGEFKQGLTLLTYAVGQLRDLWAERVEQTFEGGIPPEHPDVVVAWDLSEQIYQFLDFYAKGLSAFLETVMELPPLVTHWEEPTHEQVKGFKETSLDYEDLEEKEDFFKDFKVPGVKLEDEEQDNELEQEPDYIPSPGTDIHPGINMEIEPDIEFELDNGPLIEPHYDPDEIFQGIDATNWNPSDQDLLEFGNGVENAPWNPFVTELEFENTAPLPDWNIDNVELPE